MKQIKIISDKSLSALEGNVNEALKGIDADDPSIKYLLDQNIIVIEYEEKITKLMCVDCRHYDESVGVTKAFGLCQCRGERVRFTHKICEDFSDLRG